VNERAWPQGARGHPWLGEVVRKIKRREFLKVAAGSGGAFMAVGFGIKSPDDLIPYITPPRNLIPSVVTTFATTCRECPAGCGMHLWNRDGRVTKAEGNPDHPINHGGLCARGQSALQGLYDPDRLRQPLRRDKGGPAQPIEWKAAIEGIGKHLLEDYGSVVVISDLQTGTLAQVIEAFAWPFIQARPSPEPIYYEAMDYGALGYAHSLVYGWYHIPGYHIERCDFLISFGVDFLETWLSPVQFARQFAEMRTVRDGKMGRFVYAGSRLSMTAANADEFLQVSPEGQLALALGMLASIVEKGLVSPQGGPGLAEVLKKALGGITVAAAAKASGVPQVVIEQLAERFVKAPDSLALAGPACAEGAVARDTAAAAVLLNQAAGRIWPLTGIFENLSNSWVRDRRLVTEQLEKLKASDVLLIHNCNPAYSIPGAAEHIKRAGTVVYLGTMMDETAELADWVLPIDSPLESWGDYQPAPGLQSLMQPAMGRVFDTRAADDIFISLAAAAGENLARHSKGKPGGGPDSWLRHNWNDILRAQDRSKGSDAKWREALQRGGQWQPESNEPVRLGWPTMQLEHFQFTLPQSDDAGQPQHLADLWLWPSIMLFDGRTANRGWLQEAPDPTTHAVWGSWIDIHPSKAKALAIADGDIIELSNKAGKVEAPARVTEDVHENTVALAFGQGHTALGRNAKGRGANAFQLLGGEGPGPFGQVTIRRTGRRFEPVLATSGEQRQFGRELLQWVDLEKLRTMKPGEGTPLILPLPEGYRPDKDIYAPHEYKEHRWAMVADLARCIGCGACAVACYAENNLAVVGEERTRRGHHMPWLQVVPYRHPDDPGRLAFLPLMCQQCDAAPCEPVCPVFASVHNEEGLNAQVYNRCIGTRYCANNCPYKVRRFNWINQAWEKPLDWQLNPEVTVRVRGVMEKCTFCIQRIRAAEYRAKRENRKVRDGEIQPACVQSCPTRVYTFGDLLDGESQVTKLTRLDPRRYHVLEELNVKPAVTYLRRIANT
jgi:molybdopterin-containing oxidoreductase family iron-sulfur binding subunit